MKQPQLSVDLAPHEQQLGKYRLVAKLGQGGMGTVYLALASGLGSFRKLLVVKELRHDLPWRESSLSMFMDEAQLAARLDHPNVLQTFEAGESGGRYFLAMEYLDGEPLSTLIDHGLPLELHVYILCEVLQGLQYAHDLTDYDGTRLHVVHRDVSPQNVFITHHGQVKVVDFGVAKANNGSNITSPGVFKGKFAYAAPEQLFGRPVDGRCDVFAVGVMLWEAIAGRRFGVPKPTVDAFRVRTQGLEPRIAQVRPDVDPLLAEICDHALAIDPLERVESADVLRARLQEWLHLQGEHIQAKQIAELMRERFSDERAARQRIIERAMVDAGASQSTIAALPRELFDRERESGTSPRVEPEHRSASGISPSHAVAPGEPAAVRPAHANHASQVNQAPNRKSAPPTLSPADDSMHAASMRQLATQLKQPSRLSSAAVLLIVAAAVFGLTYQLSRKATEPPRVPTLRSGAPQSSETTSSPATSLGATATAPKAAAHTEETAREAASGDNAATDDRSSTGDAPDAPGALDARHTVSRDAARRPASHAARNASDTRDLSTVGARDARTHAVGARTGTRDVAAAGPRALPETAARERSVGLGPAATSSTPAPSNAGTRAAGQAAQTAAELDPAKAARPRPPTPRTRPGARDAMGSDLRQLRSSGPMRIDTEDPYK